MSDDIRLVYFSSVTENTKRFVDKLGFDAERIPLRASDAFLTVDYPYVLVIPTYGGNATGKGAVPKQVIKFLNNENNRKLALGVIAGGNINFGESYVLAGKIVSQKLNIPLLYSFELMGTPHEVDTAQKGLLNNWDFLLKNMNNKK